MSRNGFSARICKGIYEEDKSIAFKGQQAIKENYLDLAKTLEAQGGYGAYATHDHGVIDRLLEWIEYDNIDPKRFEFQTLYGVPMDGRLQKLVDKGYKVRIYVPFGPDWFGYSLRRLSENPDIVRYVIKNMFKN